MADRSAELSPRDVVVVDDSTRYGHKMREMVTLVLGAGRDLDDRAECVSHQEAMAMPEEFWGRFSVALVDAFDAHRDQEAMPVPVGDVVRRLEQLGSPARIVVYSGNFDLPYFNLLVRGSTNAVGYFDASALLREDGAPMRSALLDDEPMYQAAVPKSEEVVDLGEGADLAKAITALRDDPSTWRWALGLTSWGAVDQYRKRKVRNVARDRLKMAPADRPDKIRKGRELKNRSPDHGSIIEVVQAALGLSRDRK